MGFFTSKSKQLIHDRTTEIYVEGMTCGNCVKHVTKALENVEGVKNVSVQLKSNAPSLVTVLTDIEPDDGALTCAVEDAGYTVTGISRDSK